MAEKTLSRRLLTSAKAPTPDPAFHAIERHRAARAAHVAAIETTDARSPGGEAYRRAKAAQMEACCADTTSHWDLVKTHPTTLAGLLAFAYYLVEDRDMLLDSQSGADAMQTIAEALAALMASLGGAPCLSP